MWQVNLTSNPIGPPSQQQLAAPNALAAIINPELAKWYHVALFSPVNKTLLQAIKKSHFTTRPNLTVEFMKHIYPSMATSKGHMKHIRKNINSTKTHSIPPNKEEPMEILETRSNHVFTKIIDTQERIVTDLTGRFPVNSNRGNKYLFILYDYNRNCILVRPMKNRTEKYFICVFQYLHGHLTTRGIKPNYMLLDNEVSPSFQALLKYKCIDYQLAPPGIHRRNEAERTISTFKDQLISGICATDPDFPMQNWDRLLEQAEIKINLLRPSRLNPRLSAYAQLNGEFDFNRTPTAPPGTRTLVHYNPHNRGT